MKRRLNLRSLTQIERLRISHELREDVPVELHATVDLAKIASKTQGFSGRDLVEKVLKIALHQAIIDETVVGPEHFDYT